MWKARVIENYRQEYDEKINASTHSKTRTVAEASRVRCQMYEAKRRIFGLKYTSLKCADQTIPNCLLRNCVGFIGGILLTYLCFIFFVCQLSIPLVHAIIMSSIIGLLLTLGLAFSNRIRCLVLLLIPQLFSRIGRYTLTCYALILILTGPATNTLKNSEVLTESMACSQEQVKSHVRHLTDSVHQPLNAIRDSVHIMMERLDQLNVKMKNIVMSIERMVVSIADVIQSSYYWLSSVVNACNHKLGTPYEHCMNILNKGLSDCKSVLGPKLFWLCNVTKVEAACRAVKSYKKICTLDEFAKGSFAATIKRKLHDFTNRMKTMFYVHIEVHHRCTVSNESRSASQVAAGIVTEIRNKADPLITWLSWSSCVTSLFLLLIIFRAKYYQHMYETRSRFDNRYVTKELYEIDLKRFQEGRDTILPLNRREKTKYIPTTSFRLIASEKVFMTRSAVFMVITTFKLMIHMIADYSLFWVLTTIRHHGRLEALLSPGPSDVGVSLTGLGFGSDILRSIFSILTLPLRSPSSPASCLPDPRPPDFKRYTQIGIIIVILWLLALFEPYGLRLRHVIMGHHRPERAKARASWLYNHILRTRGSFMKLARRKLHREYKYHSEEHLTFRHWLDSHLPFYFLRYLFGTLPKPPHCLLCETMEKHKDIDTHLTRCESQTCPGVFCRSCFADIGQLCTICLSPADYGDYSDISLEKGSDNESDGDNDTNECKEDSSKGYIQIQLAKKYNQNFKNYDRKYKENRRIYNSEKTPLLPNIKDLNNQKSQTINTYMMCNSYSRSVQQNCPNIHRLFRQRNTKSLRNFKNISLVFRKIKNSRFLKPRRKYYIIRRISWKSKTKLMPRMYAIIWKYCFKSGHLCICLTSKPNFTKEKQIRQKGLVINHQNVVQAANDFNKLCPKNLELGNVSANDSEKNTSKNKPEEHNKNNKKVKDGKIVSQIENKKRSLYAKTICIAFATCLKLNRYRSDEVNEAIQRDRLAKKEAQNFKKRKKKNNEKVKQQNESSRDYRISAYLQDQSWVKGILRKDSLKDRIKKDCALNQLARCRLYAATNKTRETELLKVIKDTIDVQPKRCCCPHGECICQASKLQDTPKASKGQIKIPSESKVKPKSCKCKKCKAKRAKVESSPKSNKMNIIKFCRGKKYCCKVQNIQREEETSSSAWRGSDLIGVHDYDDEHKLGRPDSEVEAQTNSPKRLDFFRSIGNDFNTIGECLSNEKCGDYKQSNSDTTGTSHRTQAQKEKTTKCLRIKDLKLILSDHFLHLRIKNPAPLLKDIYTHIAQLTDLKKNKNQAKSKKVNKEKGTTEKGTTVLPILQTRSCQCFDNTLVQDRGTQMRWKSQPTTTSPVRLKSTSKKPGSSTKGKCSCATQYRYIGDNKACNSTLKSKSGFTDRNSITNEDTYSDTSLCRSFSSVFSDETKTDTTICSRLEVDYIEDKPRKTTIRRVKKIKVNVTTKTNQGTSTDKTRLCDVSTLTEDWWSPLNERKPMKKKREEAGDCRKCEHRKKNKGVTTDRRFVKFLSRAQIIPNETCDILSPSRYLLESQKYYNELFSSTLFTPQVFVALNTKGQEGYKYIAKRNMPKSRKMKRLDESARPKGNKGLGRTQSDETPRSQGNCPT
ncbi:uncharacterized protein LOC123719953 isoform X2 [Pieris brassicae]|uniref:uncharacterized protein LOC123719953 isoform X2 n=1 Tax=Pieris brassicae TaxID=7116 RepID=UPI001E65E4D8|nr:uncharacterized protein LOC123719953 isoform X2 [Pieris brassicae]